MAPFHGKPSDEIDALIKSLIKKTKKCSGCVDLAFTLPLLVLLQDPAEKDAGLRMLDDILVAMRPTSVAGERNHLVNQTNQHRGHLRDGLTTQVESLLGNIATEHRALRKAVDLAVFGKDGKRGASHVCSSRSVVQAAPMKISSVRKTNSKNVAQRIVKNLSGKVSRLRSSSAYNTYMAEKMRGCGMKAFAFQLTYTQVTTHTAWDTYDLVLNMI